MRSGADQRTFARLARFGILVALAGFTVGVIIAVLRAEPFGQAIDPDGTERLMDFASHRAFACAAWSGASLRDGASSIYSLAAHLRATEDWTHRPGHIALPFGYSPTMLLVFAPTCIVSERIAFVAWSCAGLLAIVAVARMTNLHWTALLPLATPLAIYTLALGQTAVLGTAGLLWLMMRDRTGRTSAGTTIVLWLLSSKPPLAVTAAVGLAARRRWRPIVLAVVLTTLSTVALIPWLGAGWIHDYAAILGQYDRVHLPEAFAWSIVPRTMSNLRAALTADLGVRDDVAVVVSNVLWLTCIGIIVAVARRLDWSRTWRFAVLAYLLLCPHVSATENLALCCVLATLGVPSRPRALATVIVIVLGLWLAPAIVPPYGPRPSLLFFAMLAAAALTFADGSVTRLSDRLD